MAAGALLHFIHTPLFDESAEELLGLDGLREVQAIIQANPDVGRLIKGTSGARKMRVGVGGRGKSYGARVIYYFKSTENIVYLILAYAKTEADEISEAGRRTLKSIIRDL